MAHLPRSVAAWGSDTFEDTARDEIAALGADALQLQKAMTRSAYVIDRPPQVMLIDSRDEGDQLRIRAGVFFQGLEPGCSCADDPTPVEENQEYCELGITVGKATSEASVEVL